MPLYRGPDGKIIEEKTKKGEDQTRTQVHRLPTKEQKQSMPPVPDGGAQAVGKGRLDAETVKADSADSSSQGPGEEKTRVVGPRSQQQEVPTENADGMGDPVVGWLVVVEGPGKGKAMELGYGSNSMGRGETSDVQLNFGDTQISRSNHATVTYDSRGRKFYVEKGSGRNLTYLNDEPVLGAIELPAQSHIGIGATVLRFVPLCGEAFDWQGTKENASASADSPNRQDAEENASADADSPDSSTPLHVAALNNKYKVAELLLREGADVNAKDNYGWTPLRVATLNDAAETAEVLRQYGGQE